MKKLTQKQRVDKTLDFLERRIKQYEMCMADYAIALHTEELTLETFNTWVERDLIDIDGDLMLIDMLNGAYKWSKEQK